MTSNDNLLEDIRNVNLSYLLLVQRLINEDRSLAIFRLKISEHMADALGALPISELAKLANTNQLLCHFSLTDPGMLSTLTGPSRDQDLQRTHAAILLAGQQVEHDDETLPVRAMAGTKRHGG
ncbi:flagellar transcriptional regulator FlhD [Kushneria phosphatilytica]|uniref:Flagellar transcriptional regulator FlhD n=1 Tax=Kushneria phosphatilytica TaxID=657387 RepID=A0A1S1NYV3_9GAMM|nr:flagellar transcriptional regulator FlhD [Kushneria phosphatilytica]OHV12043.1 flagellar transcriptional regulator FlhD [Kushneria phosphatilytica]QEL11233.1 flagellar transcriptional regulator FlhD [Kushneria phosphatilytica]